MSIKSGFARRSSYDIDIFPLRLQTQKDNGRRTQLKGTSYIGSTCQLLIERYKIEVVLVRVPALDLVQNWKNVKSDGNYGYRVVVDFVFRDEHQWHEVHRRMIFELEHTTNIYLSLFDEWNEFMSSYVRHSGGMDMRLQNIGWIHLIFFTS
ncbi:hypothetical protein M9H77_13200 [Catharanthus roseus]|uniref:Uncharacterized protein n=1 Tax=Catharanthus roseus TaxID=4058 RepID=A0ACC0BJP9_CATRO|nr:hypothetical protein M9H77_13200 [Catharanthus roseus]